MSRLWILRIASTTIFGVLAGFAIIGGEAAFLRQLPVSTGDVVVRIGIGLGASAMGIIVTPWLEANARKPISRLLSR